VQICEISVICVLSPSVSILPFFQFLFIYFPQKKFIHPGEKMKLSALIVLAVYFSLSFAQQEIYNSKSFSILSDRVIQGKYEAVAKADNKMISNYVSEFKRKTQNKIIFKLAINGIDNEAVPGQDHIWFLTPTNGKDTTITFKFGRPDPTSNKNVDLDYLDEPVDLLLKVDFKEVQKEFVEKGFYTTFDGSKIKADEFKGLYIAGGTAPLTWDWNSLSGRNDLQLKDPDGDGIYEILLRIDKEFSPLPDIKHNWKLSKDISALPQYKSNNLLIDALYNLSLEEMLWDIREDGAFMAGEKWPGVWTRDVSYSIILALAAINPDASKTTLMAKVKDGKIIQDTGTGGSWPISSDRMVWALAVWEIYLVTGDNDWLQNSYSIIKNSAESDLATILDPETNLFRGESSFLDWREQTYPRWMDPKDIYESKNLGTNAVHYQTYIILAEMAKLLGESSEQYLKVADGIKEGMNEHFWMNDKGYYGQYLYGRNYFSLSPRSEALGEALTVLYNVADENQKEKIVENTPVVEFGVPCIYPQIPDIPPYHNDAVWPFVEAFKAWASVKVGNTKSVEKSLAAIYRAAALFLTNKENFVATSGDYLGTEINSSRQLWSVAGNLATIYRVILGMEFTPNGLKLNPFVPKSYDGQKELKNFRYRNSILDISLKGYGNKVRSVRFDGKETKDEFIPNNLSGNHKLEIQLTNEINENTKINLVNNKYAVETPNVSLDGNKLKWNPVEGAKSYLVIKNDNRLNETEVTYCEVENGDYAEYQVAAIDKEGFQSFLSEPFCVAKATLILFEVKGGKKELAKSFIEEINTKKTTFEFECEITGEDDYLIDFHYANGNGPINTDNKCAIRSLFVDGKRVCPIVLPQRGIDNWNNRGYSNSIKVHLKKGKHQFSLKFLSTDENMNGEINSAVVDHLRLQPLK